MQLSPHVRDVAMHAYERQRHQVKKQKRVDERCQRNGNPECLAASSRHRRRCCRAVDLPVGLELRLH